MVTSIVRNNSFIVFIICYEILSILLMGGGGEAVWTKVPFRLFSLGPYEGAPGITLQTAQGIAAVQHYLAGNYCCRLSSNWVIKMFQQNVK